MKRDKQIRRAAKKAAACREAYVPPPLLTTYGKVALKEQSFDFVPPRADVLEEAKRLITGDRNNSYGPPTQDFRRTAEALTAMGYKRIDAEGNQLPLVPSDVAIMVAMVKISRLMHQRGKRDNWADLAGYAGCGYECSTEE